MAKKELNLLQFAASGTAEASATSAKIVGCKFADANFGGELLHDMPDELFPLQLRPKLYLRYSPAGKGCPR